VSDDQQAKMDEVNAECEKVQGFFEGLPEELRADAAERLIGVITLWGCRNHYQALGILAEALLSYRETSISVMQEEQDEGEKP